MSKINGYILALISSVIFFLLIFLADYIGSVTFGWVGTVLLVIIVGYFFGRD